MIDTAILQGMHAFSLIHPEATVKASQMFRSNVWERAVDCLFIAEEM